MKKVMMFLTICSFLGFNVLNIGADVLVTGGYSQQNNANQVMSVGKTQMQIGAADRAHANYINTRSGAGRSHSNTGNGGGSDFQWGSSQTENVWKAWKTVEDTGNVTGLVVGDCRGDNSTDAYFQQMNISRKGYDKENLVTQAQCEGNHKTNQ
jgi:hypothetical protein